MKHHIRRFLRGKSTAEEANEVIRELNNERISSDEWNEWKGIDAGDLNSFVASQMSADILARTIKSNESTDRSAPGFMFLKIAAVFILIAGVSFLLMINQHPVKKQPASQPIVLSSEKTFTNNGSENVLFILPDSSRVSLFPNGSITYNNDSLHYGSRRDIYLRGSGHFVVAKDSKRPFTVFSGSLYTTALGTSFDVINNADRCVVKLYTGKVIVGEVNTSSWKGTVQLWPGEQVDLQGYKQRFQPLNQKPQNPVSLPAETIAANDKLLFENASLIEVFNKLEQHFKQPIDFDTTTARHLFFTGEVLASDSLPMVMKIICNMNSLKIQDSAGILVVKP